MESAFVRQLGHWSSHKSRVVQQILAYAELTSPTQQVTAKHLPTESSCLGFLPEIPGPAVSAVIATSLKLLPDDFQSKALTVFCSSKIYSHLFSHPQGSCRAQAEDRLQQLAFSFMRRTFLPFSSPSYQILPSPNPTESRSGKKRKKNQASPSGKFHWAKRELFVSWYFLKKKHLW